MVAEALKAQLGMINPKKIFPIRTDNVAYEKLSQSESQNSPFGGRLSSLGRYRPKGRFHMPRITPFRAILYTLVVAFCVTIFGAGVYRRRLEEARRNARVPYHWEHFPR
jgi:hypothetical protein